METILLALITVLAVIVAVKAAYAILLLVGAVVSLVVRRGVVPLLRGVHLLVFRPVFWIVGHTIMLPFWLAGAILRPTPATVPVSGLTLGAVCRNGACRCANPTAARFCRQCGAMLALR